MTFLNRIFLERCQTDLRFLNAAQKNQKTVVAFHSQIDEILSYINLNLTEELTISGLADHFFLSPSYLCKIFKDSTGTTINKYITARRITKAKSLLSDGCSVTDTCSLCGFHDYSNFLKSFTRAVGISPKKYACKTGVQPFGSSDRLYSRFSSCFSWTSCELTFHLPQVSLRQIPGRKVLPRLFLLLFSHPMR